MIDSVIAFIVGAFAGWLSTPKNADWGHQKAIYEGQLAQQQGAIQYYKKLCRELAEENAEFRRKQ